MLRKAKDLSGYKLSALDGEIGAVSKTSTSMTRVGRFDISSQTPEVGWAKGLFLFHLTRWNRQNLARESFRWT